MYFDLFLYDYNAYEISCRFYFISGFFLCDCMKIRHYAVKRHLVNRCQTIFIQDDISCPSITQDYFVLQE